MDNRSLTTAPPRTVGLAAGLAAAMALAGWLGWKAYGPQDLGDPIANSLVALEKQDKLTVFSAQLSPVVAADDARLFGILKSRQVAVIPARVDYVIDMTAMDRSRMKWDAQAMRLDVTLPPIRIGRPNLDEGKAQYLREGVWITPDAQAKLTRDNSLLAEKQASDQAANPVLVDLARGAAKDAVERNLAIPLQVAGYGDVTVRVRIDGEPAPQ
ncbi:DUF4230 domain-containing protein [Novosphingobium sp.]|uniref:DUF4230 domain-containing protein n=1 Tax=Novosphingobium sp. TaxID=1874826 RepID=UPI0025CE702C|nr:DUF4230 domain-containing protein [Novosphingobium sp.]